MPQQNSWAGWPGSLALSPFVRVRCCVSGPVETPIGYVCDVKTIDQAVRSACLDVFCQAVADETTIPSLGPRLFERVAAKFGPPLELTRLELCPTPYQSLTVSQEDPAMAILTHQFEFSAAHRLHCPELSDEENRRVFGKCNSANGHGHNYVADISVRCLSDANFDLAEFEGVVCERAIARLDHKHLNIDVPEFASLNPTVENIARVVWDLLTPHVEGLYRVRIYETPKTWADVGAPPG